MGYYQDRLALKVQKERRKLLFFRNSLIRCQKEVGAISDQDIEEAQWKVDDQEFVVQLAELELKESNDVSS